MTQYKGKFLTLGSPTSLELHRALHTIINSYNDRIHSVSFRRDPELIFIKAIPWIYEELKEQDQ